MYRETIVQRDTEFPEEGRSIINRIALKIPSFWLDEPELWFAQLEGQFNLGGITQDSTKFAYVQAHLEANQAKEVKDVITKPPAINRYESLKKALLQRIAIPQEQQIRQLLEQEEIGDRRPSQFHRHLQSLARDAVPEALLRVLWMGRLPSQLQTILVTRTADSLDEIAEQADRVYEVVKQTPAVASVQLAIQGQAMEQQIQELTKQVASLNKKLIQNKKAQQKRDRSKNRSQEDIDEEGICYYHRRFKDKAKKCTQPCSFNKQEN